MTKWRLHCGRLVSALVVVLAWAGITGVVVVGTALPAAANTCPTRTLESGGLLYSLTPAPSPGVDWSNCNLANADLNSANLSNANLNFADLASASAVGAILTGAKVGGMADFTGADLTGADLSGAHFFAGAILPTNAIFANTILRAVNFTGDVIRYENFTNDDLSFANFTNADLTGATIAGANFSGATWSNTTCIDGVTNSNLTGSCPGAEAIATSDGSSATVDSGGINATAAGGTPGDTLTASTDASNPGNNLQGGTIYFDVRVSPSNTFTSLTIQDCSHTYYPSNMPTMEWLPKATPTDPNPIYQAVQPASAAGVNGQHCLQFIAANTEYSPQNPAGTTPDIADLTGTVFAVALMPTVTCTKVSGSSTGTIVVSKCSPKAKTNKSGSFTGTSWAPGGSGTLLWRTSAQSSMFALADFGQLGQGACKVKSTEEILSGTVTGGTSTYTRTGDPFAFHICVTKHHKVSLVKGTTASF